MTRDPLTDLEAEMRDHIDRETQDNIDRGMSPADARAAAMRRFGNITLAREDTRAVWVPALPDQCRQDVTYALRSMRRQPGFTTGVVAMLTIGLGLVACGYTVFNGLFVRGWAVPENHRVFRVSAERPAVPEGGSIRDGFSAGAYDHLRTQARSAEYVASTIEYYSVAARFGERGHHTAGLIVSDNFFEVLQIPLQAGTGFGSVASSSETRAVVSDGLWRRVFGGDPEVVGRPIWISGLPATVIGVTDRRFEGLGERRLDVVVEMKSPLAGRRHPAEYENSADGTQCCLMVAARMRDGWNRRQVLEELTLLTAQYRAATRQPDLLVSAISTAPGEALRTSRKGDLLVLTLSLIGAGIAFVLLLTCANVGNLHLARSLRRQREIATRLSLGASRARIVRQLLTEGLVLAAVAGLCAYAMTTSVPAVLYLMEDNATASMFPSDWRVALFTVAGVIATCLLVSLAPALQTTRIQWRGASPALSPGAGRLRGVVLATQIAIAAVLVMSAALLARGIDQATRVPIDFALHTTSVARLTPPAGGGYAPQAIEDVRKRLARALAGSDLEAGLAGAAPLGGFSALQTSVRRANSPVEYRARLVALTTPAAQVLDLQLMTGRWMGDEPGGAEIVVNQRLARQLWPDVDPLGQSLIVAYQDRAYTVVGVVRDAHLTSLGEIEPVVHLPMFHSLPVLLVRSGPKVEEHIRALVSAAAPELSVSLTPLSEAAKGSLVNARTGAMIAGSLGVVALLLSILGVFGVFSYLVEERRQEIGIRLALGATRRQVAHALYRATRGALLSGITAGLLLSLLAGFALRGLLFGLSPVDPLSYAAVSLILGLAALIAIAVPVRRAGRVDPAVTLRAD